MAPPKAPPKAPPPVVPPSFAGAVRAWIFGRLSIRIGAGSAVAVVVAAAIIVGFDFHDSKADLVRNMGDNLETAVRVGADRVDVEGHEIVAHTGDASTAEFERLRSTLRRIQIESRILSPMYTLRRDGDQTRFVVMTNEKPYVGDVYELRPGVKASFEEGIHGREGPYDDSHGTWISAWAPIQASDGTTVAVLQADYDISTLLAELRARALRTGLFALTGTLVAFGIAALTARSIAKPVQAIALAARKMEQGDFTVRVPEDREDEVGSLARAVNSMARGLAERERLRDMFGKYMASQVMDDLLAGHTLKLHGEEREVTVLISDIRGFTPLTEQLGASDVVSLLNEYFTLLVDVVMKEEGVIDKFMGDAMLCYFGAPVAQSDHRERAVRTGIAILEALSAWNSDRTARGEQPILTGIGIATGKVIVGNIGSPQRLEYTAIGDAVNLASRLCGKADAGQIVVSDQVYAAMAHDTRFTEGGSISVKGFAQPVPVHRLSLAAVRL